MIKLSNLKLENFMNIKSASFDFDHNIIIISGKSGQGKSAVFDAIALCLSSKKRSSVYSDYVKQGATHSKIELNCIINNEPVFFDLQLNLVKGTPFQMEMNYKGSTYRNTDAENLLKSFDIDYFTDIIFSMQSDDYKDITQLGAAPRAVYLQRLLNFDFQKQKDEINKVLETHKESINQITNDINLKEQLSNKELENIESLLELKLSSEDITKIQEDITEKQKRIIDFQKYQSNISKINTEIIELNNQLTFLEREENSIINKIDLINIKKKECENAEKDLNNIISNLRDLDFELKENNSIKEKDEEEIDINKIQISKIESSIEYIQQLYNEQIQFAKLEQEEKCPMCGRETTEFLKQTLEELNSVQYDGTDAKGHTFYDILMIKKDKGDTFQTICDKIEEKKQEYTSKKAELELKNKVLLMRLHSAEKIILINSSKIEDYENKRKNLENNIIQLQNNFDDYFDLNKKLKEFNIKKIDIKTNIDIKRKEISSFKQEDISKLSNEIVKQNNIISDYFNSEKLNQEIKLRNEKRKENVELYKQEIETLKENIKSIVLENNIYEEAFTILDKNLPNYMVVKTCNSLQTEMNNIIQSIFSNYEVKLQNSKRGCEFFYTKDNSIQEDKKRNNAWINSKMSSGFEKALLTMAFKLSLAQLYNINIIIGDEIDGAADDESSEKLFELLISNTLFDQIFLISHKKFVCQLIMDNSSDCIAYNAEAGKFTIVDSID